MEKKSIRLTETELQNLIREAVENVIESEELEEGLVRNKWNQLATAGRTMFQKGDMNLKNRFKNAAKNWTTQGELNDINDLSAQLSAFVEAGQLNPNMTIAQLIGGKINGNRFGRMSGMAANRIGQISKRGGSAS